MPLSKSSPRIVAIIPARYQSSRFPGKALADILGRPMIEHVYRQTVKAPLVQRVIIATDDARIFNAAVAFGAEAAMTPTHFATGTDRIAHVARNTACDIVVNVQGDEPTIEPESINAAIRACVEEEKLPMSTIKCQILDVATLNDPNVVKVVTDADGYALYFSRSPIPHVMRPGADQGPTSPLPEGTFFKHMGLYVYRRDFLLEFAAMPQTPLERLERLEQLRALEHGVKIRVVEVEHDSLGVDTPEELEQARALVRAKLGA